MLHSNDKIIDAIIDIAKTVVGDRYRYVAEDIDNNSENVIGVYVRSAGAPVMVGNQVGIYEVDITLRVHGQKNCGKKQLSDDVALLENGLIVSNKTVNDIKILGTRLRGKGQKLGDTSSGVPVFNISFIAKLNG